MLQGKLSCSLTSTKFQVLGHNPQLRNLLDSNPQLREMMQNPEFLRQLTSPETMQVHIFRLHLSMLALAPSLSTLHAHVYPLRPILTPGYICKLLACCLLAIKGCAYEWYLGCKIVSIMFPQLRLTYKFVVFLFCSNFWLCSNLFCHSLVANSRRSKHLVFLKGCT